ncbi:right-handed parallel beta-helix repeat-containing protein [Serratia proteamaculans]|uniref:right-handed parallel beta-helix repeat-containing protein n=1 Tax=Serratia proteamaculans TaxID=28151 RepID=UPI0021BAA4BC|nr:right-handed parallel beta-helix repeat-containing protein [Serratia proteamaculans]
MKKRPVISNCKIVGFNVGIDIDGCEGEVIEKNILENNTTSVEVKNSKDITFKDNLETKEPKPSKLSLLINRLLNEG